jgi:Zn-finger nucleic acid-binding protein
MGWDDGDVLEKLSTLDVFKGKSQKELLAIAQENYGYTPTNQLHFTKLNSVDIIHGQISTGVWQCPQCGTVWDKGNNNQFRNLKSYLNPDEDTEVVRKDQFQSEESAPWDEE